MILNQLKKFKSLSTSSFRTNNKMNTVAQLDCKRFYYDISEKLFKKIFITITSLLLLNIFNLASASISAVTANRIEGTVPYLKYWDDSKNAVYPASPKIKTLDQALSILVWDGTSEADGNKHFEQKLWQNGIKDLIIQVDDKLKFNDILTISKPDGNNNINVMRFFDDDGDGTIDGRNKLTGTTLKATWYDGESQQITNLNKNFVFSKCDDNTKEYRLSIEIDGLKASSTYGNPKESNFGTQKTDYIFKPSPSYQQSLIPLDPYVCYAEPSLHYGNSPNYVDPTYKAWNEKKGFALQDLTNPASNFPTIGFNGAFFTLRVDQGRTLSDINLQYKKTPLDSNLSLDIVLMSTSSTYKTYKVKLVGPKGADTTASALKFTPTEFRLYTSGSQGNLKNEVYNFNVKRWIIGAGEGRRNFSGSNDWCNERPGYKMVAYNDLSNTKREYSKTNPTNDMYMKRKIGEGLLPEWGATFTNQYKDNEFLHETRDWIWVTTPTWANPSIFYKIAHDTGFLLNYTNQSGLAGSIACINK